MLAMVFSFEDNPNARIEMRFNNLIRNNVFGCCHENGWMDHQRMLILIKKLLNTLVRLLWPVSFATKCFRVILTSLSLIPVKKFEIQGKRYLEPAWAIYCYIILLLCIFLDLALKSFIIIRSPKKLEFWESQRPLCWIARQ